MTLSRKIVVRKPTLQTTNKFFFYGEGNCNHQLGTRLLFTGKLGQYLKG